MPPQATTTRHRGRFNGWSYSKLKNWRACPRKHYMVDIAKTFKEEEGDSLLYGKAVHDMLANRIGKGTPIPAMHADLLEPWAKKVLGPYNNADDFKQATGGSLLVENQLAITEGFEQCEWFDRQKAVWHRSIVDVLKISGPVALAIDWKTGKVIEDIEQLLISSQCIFIHFPQVQRIRTLYVWLKDHAETTLDVSRNDMPELWAKLLPEVARYRAAVEGMNFPPRTSGLCSRWCPVLSCEHNGRQS